MPEFNWNWKLSELPLSHIENHQSSVFSCFSGGGGSSMGYKLAGYNVLGFNEIDSNMSAHYKKNLDVNHAYECGIQELIEKELPKELYGIDILDGSPPCTPFSMAGKRKKTWGVLKKYREGNYEQVLDTLFFEFVKLADKLRPKIVVSENVKGLLQGQSMSYSVNYVEDIITAFDKIGYAVDYFLLDASKMGVPQKRERVFFIGIQKELIKHLPTRNQFFKTYPVLNLAFNEKPIKFGAIRTEKGIDASHTERYKLMKHKIKSDRKINDINQRLYNKLSGFNARILWDHEIPPTIIAGGAPHWRAFDDAQLSIKDMVSIQAFPQNYQFLSDGYSSVMYVLGMSVPPVMIAQISYRIWKQWLKKIKTEI